MISQIPQGGNACLSRTQLLNQVKKYSVFVKNGREPSIVLSSQHDLGSNAQNQDLHQNNSRSTFVQQTRQISFETYMNFMSPNVAPIGAAQNVLEIVHTTTGLPWWATIALTTIGLRTLLTVPLSIYSAHVIARVQNLKPEIDKLSKELKREVAMAVKQYDWDEKMARKQYNRNMKRLIRELYIKHNCHPLKSSFVMLTQIPLWISMSLALRNMCGAFKIQGIVLPTLTPDLGSGGMLWFSNLLLPDATLILPLITGLSFLAIIEMNNLQRAETTRFRRALTNVFRVLSVVMVPVAATLPSCMSWYWACSVVFGLGQNVFMMLPSVRRAVRIPITPDESQTPFRDMVKVAKVKYSLKKRSSSEPENKA